MLVFIDRSFNACQKVRGFQTWLDFFDYPDCDLALVFHRIFVIPEAARVVCNRYGRDLEMGV